MSILAPMRQTMQTRGRAVPGTLAGLASSPLPIEHTRKGLPAEYCPEMLGGWGKAECRLPEQGCSK
jgi:hypothetical protein